MTRTGAFFAIASFGWYGAVWLFNEVAITFGGDGLAEVGRPVGGLYWLMTVVLPKFYLFRYPAKLFVIASLAICTLAGLGLRESRAQTKLFWLIPLLVVVVAGLGFLATCSVNLLPENVSADALFGPFESAGALSELKISLIHALVVSLILLVLVGFAYRNLLSRNSLTIACLLLTATELLIANSWLLPQIDADNFERKTRTELAIRELQTEAGDAGYPVHYFRQSNPPRQWSRESSVDRMEEVVEWQRSTLHPKHNLLSGGHTFGSFTSIASSSNREFVYQYFTNSQQFDDRNDVEVKHFGTPEYGGFLVEGTDQRVMRQFRFLDPEKVEPETVDGDWATLWKQAETTTMNSGLTMKHFSNRRCIVHCETSKNSIFAYRSLPMPGWKVLVTDLKSGQSLDDRRIEGSKFFVLANLPAGKFEVEFVYRPIALWIGAGVSCIACLLLAALPIYTRWRVLILRQHPPSGRIGA